MNQYILRQMVLTSNITIEFLRKLLDFLLENVKEKKKKCSKSIFCSYFPRLVFVEVCPPQIGFMET